MRYILFSLLFLLLNTHPIYSHPKITVIGGGLAGLTTAYRLQKLGHPCEVYEARSRAGGRVLTAYFGTTHTELGGLNIYDGGNAEHILPLIEELALGTETQELSFTVNVVSDGKFYTRGDLFKEAPELNEAAFLTLKKKYDIAKNLADLIDPFLTVNQVLRHVMEVRVSCWEGSPSSALAPEYLEESFARLYRNFYRYLTDSAYGKSPQSLHRSVAGGNSRLVEALTSRLEGHIHYEHPLRKITRGADQKIRLHFDHCCISTDYLILALPCSTLCDVIIEEGIFPDDQLLAIGTLQYGTAAKILFPIQCAQNIPTKWMHLDNWAVFLNKGNSVMTWLAGGPTGNFDSCDTQSLSSMIESRAPFLSSVFPDLVFTHGLNPIQPKEHLFSQYDTPVAISWINEEFSKGSYSNYGPGTFAFFNTFIEEYQESVRKVFRSIEGRIFFAGEHTAPQGDNGTMDGAVNSGERAARMLDKILPLPTI